MTTTPSLTPSGTDPRTVYLRPSEVFIRYGWKKSKGYEVLDSPGFPRRVGDKYRLDTLLDWEDRELAGLNLALPRPSQLPALVRARTVGNNPGGAAEPLVDVPVPETSAVVPARKRRSDPRSRRDAKAA